MACRLDGTKPLAEPIVKYFWFHHQEQKLVKI